ITAPKDVAVHRVEIYQRIQRDEGGAGAPQSEPTDGDLPQPKWAVILSRLPRASSRRSRPIRRVARVAEGAPLLREYRVYSSIEGSNPSLSAILPHRADAQLH